MNKYLITTYNDYSLNSKSNYYVYLGKWCLPNKSKFLKDHNFEIIDYHWNNRHKLYNDFKEINIIYEKILSELYPILNNYHDTNYSKEYWRLIIGLWLNYFIEVLFDRFYMLQKVSDKHDQISSLYTDYYKLQCIPKDMNEFMQFVSKDNWNEYIYSEIIKKKFKNKITLINVKNKKIYKKNGENNLSKGYVKNFIKLCFKYFFTQKSKYYFENTYLSKKNLIMLKIKLFSFNFYSSYNINFKKIYKLEQRINLIHHAKINNDFYKFLLEMIFENMPTIYLENFKEVQTKILNNYNYQLKSIFTSNSFAFNDYFKILVASKKNSGSKLIIGQHGGNDGMCKFSSIQNHQLKIADVFLSWGWRLDQKNNIKPIGNFLSFNKKIHHQKNGYGLLVSTQVPRYSYRLFSFPIASQWLDYFNDQCIFYENLTEKIQKKIIFKVNNFDYGWKEKERLISKFNTIKVNQYSPIDNLLKDSRIHIATYNGTVFLETLYYNIPTLIFWNPLLWELNTDAEKDFNLLKKIGIFYDDPVKAANKLVTIWDNIDDWWYSKEIQDVKNEFCKKYNYHNNNLINDLANILKN